MKKRILSMFLAIAMVIGLLPTLALTASAKEYSSGNTVTSSQLAMGDTLRKGAILKSDHSMMGIVADNATRAETFNMGRSFTADKNYLVTDIARTAAIATIKIVSITESSDITFYPNGGLIQGSTNPKTFTATKHLSDYYDVSWLTPSRPGCTFLGWYTSDGIEKVYDSNGIAVNGTYWKNGLWQGSGAKSFIAKWQSKTSITFQYYPNGGTGQPDNYVQWVVPATYFDDHPTDSHWNYTSGQYQLTRTGYTATGIFAKYDGSCPVDEEEIFTSYPQLCASYGLNPDTCGNAIINVYAQWKPNEYTVTLDANGGTPNGSITVTYDATYGALPSPTRTGYNFSGWFTDPTDGTKVQSSTRVTTASNHTLYAHWSAASYTVTFDANGGTLSKQSGTYSYGIPYLNLPIPTFDGRTFDGWYTVPADGSEGVEVFWYTPVSIPSDHALRAHWIVNEYPAVFQPNGGNWSGSVSDITVQTPYEEDIAAPSDPTRVGYTFNGWTPQVGTMDSTSGKTFTAQWTPNEYTLRYDSMGGSKVANKTVTYDAPYLAPDKMPKRVGFELEGWYLTKNDDGSLSNKVSFGETIVTGDPSNGYTLYANWNPISYTINYLDGTDTLDYETRKYNETFRLKSAEELGLTPPANHHFVGWTTVSGGSSMVMYADGQLITAGLSSIDGAEVDLYAVWAEDETYRVVYDPNGGSAAPQDNTEYHGNDTVSVNFTAPLRPGYTFVGWAETPIAESAAYTENGTTTFSISDDVTLYAVWKANNYTVKYEANGGNGTIADTACTYDRSLTLSDGSGFTRDGYTFKGWAVSANGDVAYVAGLTVLNLTEVAEKEIVLYAVWEADTVTVNFNANGGQLELTSRDYAYGSSYGLLPIPTREGYTFDGWYTEADNGTEVLAADAVSGDVTILFAHWTIKTCTVTLPASTDAYTVKYNSNKLTASENIVVNYGDVVDFELIIESGYTADHMSVVMNTIALGYQTSDNNTFTYKTTAITEDVSVKVRDVMPIVFPVVLNNGTGFTVSPAKQDIAYGDTLVFAVTLEDAYRLNAPTVYVDGVALNGTKNGDTYTYAVENITAQPVISISATKNDQHTVIFVSDGSVYTFSTVEHESAIARPADPVRSGYTFGGWYKTADCSGNAYAFGEKVMEDLVLYAKWTVHTYEVSYDLNGANGTAPAAQTKIHDETLLLDTTIPSRTGYTFVGWNTSADGSGIPYAAGSEYLVNAAAKLYAQWQINTYSVTLTSDDGVNASISANTVAHGDTVTITASAADGYKNLTITPSPAENAQLVPGSDCEYTITGPVAFSVTVTAKTVYTYSFYVDGKLHHTQSAVEGSGDTVILPTDPVNNGYTFLGWFIGSTQVTNQTVIESDETIVPKWEINTYTVTPAQDGDGYTVSTGEADNVVNHGESYSFAVTIEDGYNADNLKVYANGVLLMPNGISANVYNYTASDLTGDTTIVVTGVEKNVYTVTYYVAGGIYSIEQVAHGDYATAPAIDPEKEGATFTEWQLNGAAYDFRTEVTGTLNLTALFTPNDHTVTLPAVPVGYILTQNGTGTYEYEEECELTLVSAGEYSIDGAEVYINGVRLLPDFDGKYRFCVTEDVTVSVEGIIAKLPVNFNGNGSDGGAAPTDGNIYCVGDTITLPDAGFTKTGYAFLGWNTDANATYGEVGDYTIEASDVKNGCITFYAVWDKSSSVAYTVEHYLQNTTLGGYDKLDTDTQELWGVTDAYVLAVPKTYVGFTYNSAAPGTVAGGAIAADGSLVLKLFYDRNTYTVSFVPNEGEVVGSLTSYVYGVGATLPDAVRTGFTFDGWFVSPGLTGSAVSEITATDTGDKLFYAMWTENTGTTYTVVHYKQDLYGGYSPADVDNLTGTTDEYTQAVAKTYTGFTAQPIEQVKIDADGSTRVIVKYDRNSYQLTFDANGGEGGTSEQMLYEAPIVAPYVTREDWTFIGWYPAVAATMPAEDTTYTASWEQDSYTIIYDANGGSGTYSNTQHVSVLPTLYDGADFTRAGWTLVGWSTAGGSDNAVDFELGAKLDTAPVERDEFFHLYAVWKQNFVTVTFDAGDGEVSPDTLKFPQYGTYINLPIPELDDFTFTGWYTEDDELVKNHDTLASTENHTLYASWSVDSYDIVYHPNGANEPEKTVSYALNGTPTLEGSIFTRDNYDLVGWSTAPDGELIYALGAQLGYDLAENGETIHLYAIWGIADVVVEGYEGVYDGMDHEISFSLAQQVTVTEYQWYFKPAGEEAFYEVEDNDDDPTTYLVRDVAQSGTYYCHIDGLEDEYYVICFNTDETIVNITRRPITFTAANATKVYDGLPLTEGGYTFTPNGTDLGICIDHTTDVTMTEDSTITNVGQTPNVIDTVTIFDVEGIDVTENYTVSTLPGTLTVTPRDVVLLPTQTSLDVPYGTELSSLTALLMTRYEADSLGYGDELADLSLQFEYSLNGTSFAPLNDAALSEIYYNDNETFIVRPIVNSANYHQIDEDLSEITITVVKETLWAKVKWYGSNDYTNRLSLAFYNATYDSVEEEWIVDDSATVMLPGGMLPSFEIRNYQTGETICFGEMTISGKRYWAQFDPIRVQAQVFFTADGYIIRSY